MARFSSLMAAVALGLIGLRLVIDRRTAAPGWLRATWRWMQRHTVNDESLHAGPVTPSVAAWKHHALAAVGIAAFSAVMLRAQLMQMDAVTDFGDARRVIDIHLTAV